MNVNNLITPGKPVIDIGANIGNKTQEFLDLGASVVLAVEMQHDLACQLLARFENKPVIVVCAAVSDLPGNFLQTLVVPDGNTLNTIRPEWTKGRFAGYTWKKGVKVPTIDLAGLVALAGDEPSYIKIDAEGSELEIARGMKARAINPLLISFEFTKEYLDSVIEIAGCFYGLNYEFSYAWGESTDTIIPFCERQEFLKSIFDTCDKDSWGSFFARRKK